MDIKMGNGSSILMSDKGESVKSIFQEDNGIITKQTVGIKIADVFNVPVAVTNGDEHKNSAFFNGVPLLYSGSYGINYRGIIGCVCFAELPDSGTSPKFEALKAANYAAVAINSYDANQAIIAKQAERINIMLHALTEIKNTPSVRHDECSWMASVTLEATKEQV